MSTARAATPFSPSPSPSPPHHGAGGEHAQNAPDTDAARSHSNAQHALGGSGGQHGGELAHPGSGGPGGPAIEDRDELVRRELEMRVRTAVNALYELAVCAADVQEGAQGLVGSKM